MSATDREEYDAWVAARLIAFREHAGFGAFVWRESYSLAKGRTARGVRGVHKDDADAFKGPWHTVRPYVTEEFRLWIDEYLAPRLTFAEWQAEAIHRRRVESERVRDYIESAEYCTDQLEQWRELNAQRDALIVESRERGATFAEIQAATGLSRMAVHNIIARAREAAEREAVAEAEAIAAGAASGALQWVEIAPGEWVEA